MWYYLHEEVGRKEHYRRAQNWFERKKKEQKKTKESLWGRRSELTVHLFWVGFGPLFGACLRLGSTAFLGWILSRVVDRSKPVKTEALVAMSFLQFIVFELFSDVPKPLPFPWQTDNEKQETRMQTKSKAARGRRWALQLNFIVSKVFEWERRKENSKKKMGWKVGRWRGLFLYIKNVEAIGMLHSSGFTWLTISQSLTNPKKTQCASTNLCITSGNGSLFSFHTP